MAETTPMTPADMSAVLGNRWGYPYGGNSFGFGGGDGGLFASGELTVAQMGFAGDVMKDIAKLDKALSAACYYDSMSGASADKKY